MPTACESRAIRGFRCDLAWIPASRSSASRCVHPHIFGVRHLSPAAAWHLRQLLDRVRPKLVLIEGSDDADELIPHIVSPKSKLPIAILAYTADAPVRTFVYPLATYSPEYQALVWCQENKAKARFMDLPSSVFLGLMDRDDGTAVLDAEEPAEKKDESNDSEDEDAATDVHRLSEKPKRDSVYEQIARLAGEPDYETYWERHFEQLASGDTYLNAARSYGQRIALAGGFFRRRRGRRKSGARSLHAPEDPAGHRRRLQAGANRGRHRRVSRLGARTGTSADDRRGIREAAHAAIRR